MKLPCAVIQGPKGIQRVLSENGITNAILGTRSGASKRLKKAASEEGALKPLFIAPRQLKPFIDKDLLDGPLMPIDYLDGDRVVRGYDASVLVVVCNIWLRAREARALQKQQLGKAQKAEILTRALAHTGIVALVDEATGYEKVRPQNALQEYLAHIIRKELAAWVKKFPDEFYENIYKLKGWVWPGMSKNRYSVVGHYTNNLVFERLAPGLLTELQSRSPKNEKGYRGNRLHQWLTEEVGDPMLAQHLHSLMMFQRLAIANGYGWQRFAHGRSGTSEARRDLGITARICREGRGRQLRRPHLECKILFIIFVGLFAYGYAFSVVPCVPHIVTVGPIRWCLILGSAVGFIA